MRHLHLALVLLSGLALAWVALNAKEPTSVVLQEGSGVPLTLPQALQEGLELQRFAVEGMCSCSGCPTKLYLALTSVEGVEHAAIDPVIKQAKVHAIHGTDPGTIEAALTFEDYSARQLTY